MDTDARRKQVTHALAELSEVVADILAEASQEGEAGLTAKEIRLRSGMSVDDEPVYNILRNVLHHMAEDGIVVNDKPGYGQSSWRLSR